MNVYYLKYIYIYILDEQDEADAFIANFNKRVWFF